LGMYPILCEDLVRGGDWWVAVDVRLRKEPEEEDDEDDDSREDEDHDEDTDEGYSE